MKWKLTARYLLSILIVVGIVVVANMMILLYLLANQNNERLDDGETFTRDFTQYLEMTQDGPVITEQGLQLLAQQEAWVQLLDENGQVVADGLAPDDKPQHYSPVELIHLYKYMNEDLTIHFVGQFEQYSYLIGFTNSQERRYSFILNNQSFVDYIGKAIGIILLVDLCVAAMIGLLFSTILTKPVAALIERISQLKTRDFSTKKNKRVGIYKPVFSNLNDVSETLQSHEEERLKLEKMRAEWISNVSHDLKTPLASITGYAELLRDGQVSAAERLEYAEVIERKSIYMKDLLDDFNLTMRLRHADLPLSLQPTEMNHFVREMVIDLLNDPQFGHRDIQFEAAEQDVTWSIDRHLMKRALLNFIYNALIHNEEAVCVTVAVCAQHIEIRDNGKGIEEQHLPQIFERYYRGSHTENIHGTGLGMAIARDIIEAHHGQIDLQSTVGRGTTITVQL